MDVTMSTCNIFYPGICHARSVWTFEFTTFMGKTFFYFFSWVVY